MRVSTSEVAVTFGIITPVNLFVHSHAALAQLKTAQPTMSIRCIFDDLCLPGRTEAIGMQALPVMGPNASPAGRGLPRSLTGEGAGGVKRHSSATPQQATVTVPFISVGMLVSANRRDEGAWTGDCVSKEDISAAGCIAACSTSRRG